MFNKLLRAARPFILAALFLTVGVAFAVLLSGGNAIAEQQHSVGKTDMVVATIASMPPAGLYGSTGERSDMLSAIVCSVDDHGCFVSTSWLEAKKLQAELIEDYNNKGAALIFYEGTPGYEAAIDFIGAPDDETPDDGIDTAWDALLVATGNVAAIMQ